MKYNKEKDNNNNKSEAFSCQNNKRGKVVNILIFDARQEKR